MRNGVRGVAAHETVRLEQCIPFAIDCLRVRLYGCGCRGVSGLLRRTVLAVSRGRAIALGNNVFLPDRHDGDLAVLAHELTHCGQYQAWGPVRYFARGALEQLRHLFYRKLGIGSNPYHYHTNPPKPFTSYGMEQQAQMVEDRFRSGQQDHAMPSA
jgi:uncharacterized protein DUF4157